MCCRLTVTPLVPDVAEAVLLLGLFVPDPSGGWRRTIIEEGCYVSATTGDGLLFLAIQPSISSDEHHIGKRVTAGVYFEIAAKYAEKVGGTVVQLSNVGRCRLGADVMTEHVVAQYPDAPLMWERVCPGFRAVILGEDTPQ